MYFIDRVLPLLTTFCIGQKKSYNKVFFKVANEKAVLSYYYSSKQKREILTDQRAERMDVRTSRVTGRVG